MTSYLFHCSAQCLPACLLLAEICIIVDSCCSDDGFIYWSKWWNGVMPYAVNFDSDYCGFICCIITVTSIYLSCPSVACSFPLGIILVIALQITQVTAAMLVITSNGAVLYVVSLLQAPCHLNLLRPARTPCCTCSTCMRLHISHSIYFPAQNLHAWRSFFLSSRMHANDQRDYTEKILFPFYLTSKNQQSRLKLCLSF
jgi:hypothetical protein